MSAAFAAIRDATETVGASSGDVAKFRERTLLHPGHWRVHEVRDRDRSQPQSAHHQGAAGTARGREPDRPGGIEFEGDAVLFFRRGAPPTLAELIAQAKKMFVDFHSHLKQLEVLRVCQCSACARASRISLKFIVHLGPARTMEVKGHSKFIGKSIIGAFRNGTQATSPPSETRPQVDQGYELAIRSACCALDTNQQMLATTRIEASRRGRGFRLTHRFVLPMLPCTAPMSGRLRCSRRLPSPPLRPRRRCLPITA
ncbi:DUF2652 domain-containing protein [Variovorax paradoxus]|nr:DUF2652 domain-containing protein [Variovorax paradoxus]